MTPSSSSHFTNSVRHGFSKPFKEGPVSSIPLPLSQCVGMQVWDIRSCAHRNLQLTTALFGDMFDVENYWICIHLFFSQILTLKFNDKHIKWRKMQHDRLWRVTSRSCVSYYRHCIRQILDVWHGIKNVNPRTSRWHILHHVWCLYVCKIHTHNHLDNFVM